MAGLAALTTRRAVRTARAPRRPCGGSRGRTPRCCTDIGLGLAYRHDDVPGTGRGPAGPSTPKANRKTQQPRRREPAGQHQRDAARQP